MKVRKIMKPLFLVAILAASSALQVDSSSKLEPESSVDQLKSSFKSSLDQDDDIKRIQKPASDQLVAQPSTTSIHQIWTSTSGDSMEELSPEMISKLRGDVPFLAAYATRPRLLNGAAVSLRPVATDSYGVGTQLQVGASSQVPAPPVPSGIGLSKLGDFNEFNVETSSSSLSEHMHSKRTSLKRKPTTSNRLSKTTKKAGQKSKRARRRRRPSKGQMKLKVPPQKGNLQASNDTQTDEGLKGGTGKRKGKPFYQAAESADGETGSQERKPDEGDAKVEDDDAELDEYGPEITVTPTPKRVGDDDVDEVNGDTVMVEPKSDGVDDDPEVSIDNDVEDDTASTADQPENSATDDKQAKSAVGGGGIGATVGGAGNSPADRSPGVDYDGDKRMEEDHDEDHEVEPDKRSTSGTYDDRNRDDVDNDRRSGREPAKRRENPQDIDHDKGHGGENDHGTGITSERAGKSSGRSGATPSGDRDDIGDVDYRDELDAPVRSGGGSSSERGHSSAGDHSHKPHKSNPACSDHDGSHDHHGDHHHDHHNSIQWLRDAVPGQPGVNYPILSLSNVSSTRFKCSDQKYPGYYADVEARCQLFHICQADGRQDSFVCPNGTIFSQITTVCVWWNSFECEDAPKYYDLNGLLYKTKAARGRTDGHGNSLPEMRMLPEDSIAGDSNEGETNQVGGDGSPKRRLPKEYESSSSFDSMIRSMRRNEDSFPMSSIDDIQSAPVAGGPRNRVKSDIDPSDDEITQRKSNTFANEPAQLDDGSARLRARGMSRRRRASLRQAPPKLKPRRVLRHPRRRKLRHGPPKRRS